MVPDVLKMEKYMHIEVLRQKKIGIALSCGAARGFAHLGVLDELERAGIHPCCIAGSSAGALVGALYSGGRFQDYIERIPVSYTHLTLPTNREV